MNANTGNEDWPSFGSTPDLAFALRFQLSCQTFVLNIQTLAIATASHTQRGHHSRCSVGAALTTPFFLAMIIGGYI
ncbi:uncharacterized protein B0H18DRAFT_108727 [Fomitopsis serialis]|uniref:uncharacterized protein n=1 Tax=Fomitopsis serialis TaxID=139415 RepID=UPI00200766B0|nr:uncharacterized protein B0H18DRAFT_108727 [Neoantrodia serialis]KAH9915122.1 hypothetical protein B0H18DRAFT_108727 [Neoantrodia serialis]